MDRTVVDPAVAVGLDGPRPRPTHIVGIGASAGGLEALERFFESLPSRTGMAFVVVQHLSPDFRSVMDELLARRTGLPIHRVEDNMEVEADSIYLIPPKKDMIIANGRLLVTDKDPSQMPPLPIDHFFRSLAHDVGERAIGIILSGTGSDGSRGIRDIHDAGGLVVMQSLDTAKFDGMPKSAEKTGVVDLVLAPEDMPNTLLEYANRFLEAGPSPIEPVEKGLDAVFRLLRGKFDIDFSCYKPSTVGRRIERRLLLNHAADLEDYIKRLAEDPNELNALYKDLLIGVTRFFRDERALERLDGLLPEILARRGPEDEIRVWIAGCATGEEAYSIAILMHECLERTGSSCKIKIFATDVHRASLEVAGAGVYPESSLADVAPSRLERYFTRKGADYQVAPELRKMVVFAHHNLIKDAPFTKLDVISCRNLLIYLQPGAQKKVMSLFHFALRSDGLLLLGPSETPGELSDEFVALDPHWKIYRKHRDRLPLDMRVPLSLGAARGRPESPFVPAGPMADHALFDTYDALLEQFMPPSLLVNDQRQLVQTFQGANRYLRIREGRLVNDVLELVDADLRIALAGAMQRSMKEGDPVHFKGLRVQTPQGERLVNVSVRPLRSRRTSSISALIVLEDLKAAPEPADTTEIDLQEASRDRLHSVETELRFTRENLQATIEELETSNEELQATNEELVASNEELQSTNEELHSVNEELYTVNAEYQKKIAELTDLTADLENLYSGTEVHTVFLDRNLCIRRFTPKMGELFNLMPQDIGRRIDSFTYNVDHPTLLDDLHAAVAGNARVERQVRNRRGNWFFLRVLPYVKGTDVDGAVITLIDVQALKQAEAAIGEKDRLIQAILRNSSNPIFVKDLTGRYVLADESFRRLVQSDPVGKTDFDLFPHALAQQHVRNDERVLRERAPISSEEQIQQTGGRRTYLTTKFPLFDEEGRVSGIGGLKTDISSLKEAENSARLAAEQRDRFLAMLSHELRNPLNAILNAVGMTDRLHDEKELHHWHRVIERRAGHMARLLDDLLDMARLTHGKIDMRFQMVDLRSLVSEVLEETRRSIDDQELALDMDATGAPLVVQGDPDRLVQIQVNLLNNAIKFTPAGGRIGYRLEQDNGSAVIRVCDTGIGIAPEMLGTIFDLFVQSGMEEDRSRRGLGIGLSLVRSIVQAHRGTITAHSPGPGQGSEFVVRLPLCSDAPSMTSGEAVAIGARRAPKVLIVEDDADSRESLRAFLSLDGFDVRVAGTGAKAIALIDEEVPDVAVVDIDLPEWNGHEVARRIRERYGDRIRLIALTGHGRAGDRAAALQAGFDEHITKPIRPGELSRLLSSLGHSLREVAHANHNLECR